MTQKGDEETKADGGIGILFTDPRVWKFWGGRLPSPPPLASGRRLNPTKLGKKRVPHSPNRIDASLYGSVPISTIKEKLSEARSHLDGIRQWLRAGMDTLEILHHAREGGLIAKVVAATTIAGKVLDIVVPPPDPWSIFARNDLLPESGGTGRLMHSLMAHHPDKTLVAQDEDLSAFFFYDEDGAPALGISSDNSEFIYVHPERGERVLSKILSEFWKKGNELQLIEVKGGSVNLLPLDEASDYVGNRDEEWYASRLRRYPPGARTVLFRGPSGVGKSVLARRTASLLLGDELRLLKVSGEVIHAVGGAATVDVVKMLRPNVVIFDDMDLNQLRQMPNLLDLYLSLFEGIRTARCLVFITMMTNIVKPGPGSWYVEGMRPGRIDETFQVSLPNAQHRREILLHYARKAHIEITNLDEIVKSTVGLPGAYLAQIVERLAAHGEGDWRHEVRQILFAAPTPLHNENEEDDYEDVLDDDTDYILESEEGEEE